MEIAAAATPILKSNAPQERSSVAHSVISLSICLCALEAQCFDCNSSDIPTLFEAPQQNVSSQLLHGFAAADATRFGCRCRFYPLCILPVALSVGSRSKYQLLTSIGHSSRAAFKERQCGCFKPSAAKQGAPSCSILPCCRHRYCILITTALSPFLFADREVRERRMT